MRPRDANIEVSNQVSTANELPLASWVSVTLNQPTSWWFKQTFRFSLQWRRITKRVNYYSPDDNLQSDRGKSTCWQSSVHTFCSANIRLSQTFWFYQMPQAKHISAVQLQCCSWWRCKWLLHFYLFKSLLKTIILMCHILKCHIEVVHIQKQIQHKHM